ncbi:hypothetical protein [Arthrobacter sp. SRS-W-1-2016]|uniref:hypothetical protein n=1 Tax=Arthrobacter sp. SRS-W-1-2016 TaxID=1930254 RepID=UPI00209B6C09|nr:hypothetical protein [Arthrobacter sp. SRS-W-1-2016]
MGAFRSPGVQPEVPAAIKATPKLLTAERKTERRLVSTLVIITGLFGLIALGGDSDRGDEETCPLGLPGSSP